MVKSLLLSLACLLAVDASPLRNTLSAREMSGSPSVSVKNGTINGRYEAGFEQDLFLSLPYAQPPVGDLRMRNPIPFNSTWSETYDATAYRNVCPGYGPSSSRNESQGQFYTLDEDCLTLHVIRPSGTSEGDKLPVLFWIYGGGYVQGTANDPRYNGSYLVQRSVELNEPIIFVSINYRLSAFGFPGGEASREAGVLNLGTKDQRTALRWVNENIGAFGGDKYRVTLWGQSAGGSSVVNQIVAYGGKDEGLVAGVVTTSGTGITANSSLARNTPGWNSLLNVTGCAGEDQLSCLRALPYQTLYEAIGNSTFSGGPVPDGELLTGSTTEAFTNGKVVPVPILFGVVRDEATSGIGAPVGINNDTAFRAVATRFLAPLGASNDTIDNLLTTFPNNTTRGCPFETGDGVLSSGLQDKRVNWLYTDNLHAGARYYSQVHSNRAPVFSFRFNQVPQNQTIEAGVAHANELPYTFGVLNRTVRTPLGYRPKDEETSKYLQTYLINFVNSADPNKGAKTPLSWPKYDSSQSNLIFQNKNLRVEADNYRSETINFLIDTAVGK